MKNNNKIMDNSQELDVRQKERQQATEKQLKKALEYNQGILRQNGELRQQLDYERMAVVPPLLRHGANILRKVRRMLPAPALELARKVFYNIATLFSPDGEYANRYRDYLRATAGDRSVSSTPLSPDDFGVANDGKADVIVFPIIDWSFRTQRPQHIATQLARGNHRVFYLATTFLASGRNCAYEITASPEKNLFLLKLPTTSPHPVIYSETLSKNQKIGLVKSIENFLVVAKVNNSVALVGHPFWFDVAKSLHSCPIIYDCMDYHAGFSNVSPMILAEEAKLITEADKVVVSSAGLAEKVAEKRTAVLIRNGADVHLFGREVAKSKKTTDRRKIGYVGAISEWFDTDLVAHAAQNRPEWDFELVGSCAGANIEKLRGLQNVKLTGEVEYRKVPVMVASFDVCLIPFKLTELILHTNPVKLYEYLSAGKPVVATPMPELLHLEDGLVFFGATEQTFLQCLDDAIVECNDPEKQAWRSGWAKDQSWENRAKDFGELIADLLVKRK